MTDLLILGNGMAGMTAALYAKRAKLDFKLIGKDSYDFGQINNAVLVENFPCVEPKSGFELADSLRDQLEANGIEAEEHGEITDIKRVEDGTFRVYTTTQWVGAARSIIYALGCTPRELSCKCSDVPPPMHYCAICDGPLYANKWVAVVGGGDAAFTQAEFLSKYCEKVFIVMCDENVTAFPETFERVTKLENVEVIYNYPIDKIDYEKTPSHWRLVCNKQDFDLYVDGIFIAIGMMPNTKPLENLNESWPLLNKSGYVMAIDDGETTIPGLYVAGDIRCKKLRQALTAAADGAYAATAVSDYLKELIR